jgi:HEAT repeat protein
MLPLLLVVSPQSNAQSDRPREPAEPSETAKQVSRLTAALKDRSYWPNQYRAAEALGQLRPAAKDAVPALVAALNDPEIFVRYAAVRALDKIGILSPKVVAALKAAAKDETPLVRNAALEVCERLLGNATREDVPALIAELKDAKSFLRSAAARLLGEVGSISGCAEVLPALKGAMKDKDPNLGREATAACQRLLNRTTRQDVPALLAALKDSEPFVRRAAARALGQVGDLAPETLAALKTVAKDETPPVREAAIAAYEKLMGKATRNDVPVLIAELKDMESPARRSAARALGKAGALSTSPDAMAALKAAMADKDPDVRRAATQAWERNSALVEPYLLQGRLAEGEAALSERLKVAPQDDQARFGLGVLRFIRGVERLGQALHKCGCRSGNTNIPILRLPVPKNPDPAPISYADLRRVLDDFYRDLFTAEAILADVTDDKVKLPLHLAVIRLDLIGEGKPTDEFLAIVKKIMQRQQFDFQKSNPDLLVCFDRGDVAWLRAYCHLLMAMLDFYLAFDTEQLFDLTADELFARPRNRFAGDNIEKQRKMLDASRIIVVKEPARLGQFRQHFLRVAELNRETWKHIRTETDDDHEWLPNPKQEGVLGLPVRNEMIDTWLVMMAELEALLDGERTFSIFWSRNGKGLNLKTLLDDPPAKFVLDGEFPGTLADKYFSERKEVNFNVIMAVFQIFSDPATAVTYAAWFN